MKGSTILIDFEGGTILTLNIICHFWVGTCRVKKFRFFFLPLSQSYPLLPILTRTNLLLPALACSYPLLPTLYNAPVTGSYLRLPGLISSYQILPAVTHSYLLLPALANSYPLLYAPALTYSNSLKPNKPALTFPHNLFFDITLSYTLF